MGQRPWELKYVNGQTSDHRALSMVLVSQFGHFDPPDLTVWLVSKATPGESCYARSYIFLSSARFEASA